MTSLTLCEKHPLECQLGYKGSPVIGCDYNGTLNLDGMCSVIGCGTPPLIAHAEVVGKEKFWVSGQSASYNCMRGYRGSILCFCETSGLWNVSGGCQIVGCGAGAPSIDHAKPWNVSSLKATFAGENIKYKCDNGFRGIPAATCGSDSEWSISGSCTLFITTYGCQCKPRWTYCNWRGENCKEEYGCSRAGEYYHWCDVIPKSCPAAAYGIFGEPEWDECSAEAEVTPKELPPAGLVYGILKRWKQVTLYVLVLLGLLVLLFVRLRSTSTVSLRRQSRQSQCCQTDGGGDDIRTSLSDSEPSNVLEAAVECRSNKIDPAQIASPIP